MKIALINENSQAAKNALIEAALRKTVEPMGHTVVNYVCTRWKIKRSSPMCRWASSRRCF